MRFGGRDGDKGLRFRVQSKRWWMNRTRSAIRRAGWGDFDSTGVDRRRQIDLWRGKGTRALPTGRLAGLIVPVGSREFANHFYSVGIAQVALPDLSGRIEIHAVGDCTLEERLKSEGQSLAHPVCRLIETAW